MTPPKERITPEQLERVHEFLAALKGWMCDAEYTAIAALLAAYEQEKARGDKDFAEMLSRAMQAEAERDTAQASEARLREALTRAELILARLPADRGPAHMAYRILADALRSTPDPEERCDEPQTEGHREWCDCSKCVPKRDAAAIRGPAPAHDVAHGARWINKEDK